MSAEVSGQQVPRLRGLRYLGSHPDARHPLDRVDVTFDDVGVHFDRRDTTLGHVPWTDVADLSAEPAVTERVSFLGVLLLGVLAWLLKVRERRVMLRIADRRGAWVFEVKGISATELSGGLAVIQRRYQHRTRRR